MMIICLSAGTTWGDLRNDRKMYHDYDETVDAMIELKNDYPSLVTLKIIGQSYDIPEYPWDNNNKPAPGFAYDIYAMRIGPVDPQYHLQDDGDNVPSILFVGGIHGREWLGSESLLYFARHLVEERLQDPDNDEYALLRRVAVWIIPIANPAGRMVDDTHSGDPFFFYRWFHRTADGWRHSADRRGCLAATDIARNFSTDWGGGTHHGCANDGWNKHFEGLAAFSTSEATALREFVQNHWICMAVDVHSWTQLISSPWGEKPSDPSYEADVAGVKMKIKAAKIWDRGLGKLAGRIFDPPRRRQNRLFRSQYKTTIDNFVNGYSLATPPRKGATSGQFTAWLASEQHIQTFLIELPPHYNHTPPTSSEYDNISTSIGKEFRFEIGDASNAFHPSSSRVSYLIWDSFIPMAMYLIGQANAPGSATEVEMMDIAGRGTFAVDYQDPGSSPRGDFGIIAAKIGYSGEPGAPGQIDSKPAAIYYDSYAGWTVLKDAVDYLYHADNYELYYWVQNFGSMNSRGFIELELKRRPYGEPGVPWTNNTTIRDYQLIPLEKVLDSFSFELQEEMDYELTVKAIMTIPLADDFSKNNEKVFKFTTHPWLPLPNFN